MGTSGVRLLSVTTCHRLRPKPIGEFTVEDLRILGGQKIGLRFLVPVALEAQEREPLAEGDYYPGDLLGAVLKAGGEFWQQEWEWAGRVGRVIERVREVPTELADDVAEFERACGRTRR